MLVRAFSKIGADGKVFIPANVLRATGMGRGERIEIKVTGGGKKYILISSIGSPGLKKRPRILSIPAKVER